MSTARDIAIIVLAAQSIIIGVLLSILVVQVIRLVRMLKNEVMPILNSTQEAVGTVRGTASFMSEHLVQPVVKVSSAAAGARQIASVIGGGLAKRFRK